MHIVFFLLWVDETVDAADVGDLHRAVPVGAYSCRHAFCVLHVVAAEGSQDYKTVPNYPLNFLLQF